MRHHLSALSLSLAMLLGGPALLATPATTLAKETAIHPVRGFLPDLRFTLSGVSGTVTEKNLQGKVAVLFFGYASCPDICPTTMAQLAEVMHALGPLADQVQVVFISVDPHRDTPQVLQAYVELFNENALGLTGTEKQIADVARRYRVSFQIEKPVDPDSKDYEVAHSRGIYIFDSAGRARLLATDGESVASLAAAIRQVAQP